LRRLHHIHRNIGLNSRDSSASIATRRVNRIVAGGLGPDNVIDSISAEQPAGVNSKTKTDKDDGSHTKDLQKVSRFERICSIKSIPANFANSLVYRHSGARGVCGLER